MKIQQILQEAKFDSPIIAIHGTSDANLSSILSNGLIPTDNKTHGAGVGGDENKRNMDSIGGVYLTYKPLLASAAASAAKRKNGGDELYIIVQLQPKSLYVDEDDIENIHPHFPGQKGVSSSQAIGTFLELEYETKYGLYEFEQRKEIFLNGIESFVEDNEIDELINNFPQINQELYELVKSYYRRIGSYYDSSNSFSLISQRSIIGFYDRHFKDQMSVDEFLRYVMEDLIGGSYTAEQEYRYYLDLLTKRLNRVIKKSENKYSNIESFRYDGVINYKGSNKILTIVRFLKSTEDSEIRTDVDVIYGNLNGVKEEIVLKLLESRIGAFGIKNGEYQIV